MRKRIQKAAYRLDDDAPGAAPSPRHRSGAEKKKGGDGIGRSSRLFEAVVEAFPEFALVTDREGVLLFCNSRVKRRLLRKGGCGRSTIFDLFPVVTPEFWEEAFSGHRQSRETLRFERESEGRFFSFHLRRVDRCEQRRDCIFVFVQDVSDFRHAERALASSERKYRELVENISDAVFSLNESGDVIYVNPAIESFLGFSQEEAKGKPFVEFIHPTEATFAGGEWEGLLAGRTPRREYRFLHKDGGARWGRVTSRPVVFKDEVIGYQGVIADVTQTKTLDINLLAVLQENVFSSLASAFTAEIGKNLKSARERLISHSAPSGPEAEINASLRALMHDLESISLYVKHFSAVTDRPPAAARLDINAMAESALALLTRQFSVAGVEIKTQLARNLEPVTAESFSLVQSFINVFTYSLHACRGAEDALSTKSFSLKTYMEKDEVILDVRDTFGGVPAELIGRLSDPVSAQRIKRGAGAGLAIARQLVESQGGSFRVLPADSSADPPVGTHIRISFPSIIQTI